MPKTTRGIHSQQLMCPMRDILMGGKAMNGVGEVAVFGDREPLPPGLLFRTVADIVSALRRARDFYDPRSGSLLHISGHGSRDVDAEPFRSGFIGTIEELTELIELLRLLDERGRRLLLMWFVEARPVAHIARALHMSRVHAYRTKNKAFDMMLATAKRRARVRAGTHNAGKPLSAVASSTYPHTPTTDGEMLPLRAFDR